MDLRPPGPRVPPDRPPAGLAASYSSALDAEIHRLNAVFQRAVDSASQAWPSGAGPLGGTTGGRVAFSPRDPAGRPPTPPATAPPPPPPVAMNAFRPLLPRDTALNSSLAVGSPGSRRRQPVVDPPATFELVWNPQCPQCQAEGFPGACSAPASTTTSPPGAAAADGSRHYDGARSSHCHVHVSQRLVADLAINSTGSRRSTPDVGLVSARRSSAEDGAELFTPTPRLPSGRSSPVDEVADRRRSLGDGGRGLEVCHGLSSANTPVSSSSGLLPDEPSSSNCHSSPGDAADGPPPPPPPGPPAHAARPPAEGGRSGPATPLSSPAATVTATTATTAAERSPSLRLRARPACHSPLSGSEDEAELSHRIQSLLAQHRQTLSHSFVGLEPPPAPAPAAADDRAVSAQIHRLFAQHWGNGWAVEGVPPPRRPPSNGGPPPARSASVPVRRRSPTRQPLRPDPTNPKAIAAALLAVEDLVREAETSYLTCHRHFTAVADGRWTQALAATAAPAWPHPHSVPEVMRDLQRLQLKLQRERARLALLQRKGPPRPGRPAAALFADDGPLIPSTSRDPPANRHRTPCHAPAKTAPAPRAGSAPPPRSRSARAKRDRPRPARPERSAPDAAHSATAELKPAPAPPTPAVLSSQLRPQPEPVRPARGAEAGEAWEGRPRRSAAGPRPPGGSAPAAYAPTIKPSPSSHAAAPRPAPAHRPAPTPRPPTSLSLDTEQQQTLKDTVQKLALDFLWQQQQQQLYAAGPAIEHAPGPPPRPTRAPVPADLRAMGAGAAPLPSSPFQPSTSSLQGELSSSLPLRRLPSQSPLATTILYPLPQHRPVFAWRSPEPHTPKADAAATAAVAAEDQQTPHSRASSGEYTSRRSSMWSGSGAARPLGRALEQAVPLSTPAPPPAAAVPNAVGTPGADRPSSSVVPLGPADGVVSAATGTRPEAARAGPAGPPACAANSGKEPCRVSSSSESEIPSVLPAQPDTSPVPQGVEVAYSPATDTHQQALIASIRSHQVDIFQRIGELPGPPDR